MGAISFAEGFAFSTTLYLFSLACRDWSAFALLAVELPLYLAILFLTYRHAQALGVAEEEARWMRTTALRESELLARWTFIGGLLGSVLFWRELPAALAAAVTFCAGLFGVAQSVRYSQDRQLNQHKEANRKKLQTFFTSVLEGQRTFLSLGAERYQERLLRAKFTEFARNLQTQTEKYFVPARVQVWISMGVGAVVVAVGSHWTPQNLPGLLFLTADLFVLVHFSARRRLLSAPSQIREEEPQLVASRLPVATGAIDRLQIRDLVLDTGSFRIGPVHLDIQRGEIKTLPQPDLLDLRSLLSALAGLSACQSGIITLMDRDSRVLATHQARNSPLVSVDWVAYWERRPVFFPASVRENLVFANPDRWSDWKVWEVLERLGADGLVRDLGGLDAVPDWEECDRSELLILALARALLPGRPLLVMEHPGYVGELEWLLDRLRRSGDFPATLIGMVMVPCLSAEPLAPPLPKNPSRLVETRGER